MSGRISKTPSTITILSKLNSFLGGFCSSFSDSLFSDCFVFSFCLVFFFRGFSPSLVFSSEIFSSTAAEAGILASFSFVFLGDFLVFGVVFFSSLAGFSVFDSVSSFLSEIFSSAGFSTLFLLVVFFSGVWFSVVFSGFSSVAL